MRAAPTSVVGPGSTAPDVCRSQAPDREHPPRSAGTSSTTNRGRPFGILGHWSTTPRWVCATGVDGDSVRSTPAPRRRSPAPPRGRPGRRAASPGRRPGPVPPGSGPRRCAAPLLARARTFWDALGVRHAQPSTGSVDSSTSPDRLRPEGRAPTPRRFPSRARSRRAAAAPDRVETEPLEEQRRRSVQHRESRSGITPPR